MTNEQVFGPELQEGIMHSFGTDTVLAKIDNQVEYFEQLFPMQEGSFKRIADEASELRDNMTDDDPRRQAVYPLHVVDIVESESIEDARRFYDARYYAGRPGYRSLTDTDYFDSYMESVRYTYERLDLSDQKEIDVLERKLLLTEISNEHMDAMAIAQDGSEVIDEFNMLFAAHMLGDRKGAGPVKRKVGASKVMTTLSAQIDRLDEVEGQNVQDHFSSTVMRAIELASDKEAPELVRKKCRSFVQSCQRLIDVWPKKAVASLEGLAYVEELVNNVPTYLYGTDGEGVADLSEAIDNKLQQKTNLNEKTVNTLISRSSCMIEETLAIAADDYGLDNAAKILQYVKRQAEPARAGTTRTVVPFLTYVRASNMLTSSLNQMTDMKEEDITDLDLSVKSLPESFRRIMLVVFHGEEDKGYSDEFEITERFEVLDSLVELIDRPNQKKQTAPQSKDVGKAALKGMKGQLPNKGRVYWKRWAPGAGVIS